MKINGIPVIAPIVPNDSRDKYPTHLEEHGKGGYRTVETIAQRDSIPVERQKKGMLVNVLSTERVYKLLVVSSELNETNWEEFKTSSDLDFKNLVDANRNTLQILRGSTSNRLQYIPLLGEPIWDLFEEKLYIGDGVTVGGKPATKEQIIDISSCVPGNPPSEANVNIFIVGRAINFPINFSGSKAYALTPQISGNYVLQIRVNNIEIGNIIFEQGANAGQFFSNNQPVSLNIGDILTVRTPITNPTIADLTWYFLGALS